MIVDIHIIQQSLSSSILEISGGLNTGEMLNLSNLVIKMQFTFIPISIIIVINFLKLISCWRFCSQKGRENSLKLTFIEVSLGVLQCYLVYIYHRKWINLSIDERDDWLIGLYLQI